MTGVLKEWLNRALEDLKTVEKLLDDEALTNIAAFHSQQCIEKCFKSVIEGAGKPVPRVHDLVRLAGIVADIEEIPADESTLIELSTIYLGSRYPGTTGFLPSGKPEIEDIRKFHRVANEIYHSVLKLDTRS